MILLPAHVKFVYLGITLSGRPEATRKEFRHTADVPTSSLAAPALNSRTNLVLSFGTAGVPF